MKYKVPPEVCSLESAVENENRSVNRYEVSHGPARHASLNTTPITGYHMKYRFPDCGMMDKQAFVMG